MPDDTSTDSAPFCIRLNQPTNQTAQPCLSLKRPTLPPLRRHALTLCVGTNQQAAPPIAWKRPACCSAARYLRQEQGR